MMKIKWERWWGLEQWLLLCKHWTNGSCCYIVVLFPICPLSFQARSPKAILQKMLLVLFLTWDLYAVEGNLVTSAGLWIHHLTHFHCRCSGHRCQLQAVPKPRDLLPEGVITKAIFPPHCSRAGGIQLPTRKPYRPLSLSGDGHCTGNKVPGVSFSQTGPLWFSLTAWQSTVMFPNTIKYSWVCSTVYLSMCVC